MIRFLCIFCVLLFVGCAAKPTTNVPGHLPDVVKIGTLPISFSDIYQIAGSYYKTCNACSIGFNSLPLGLTSTSLTCTNCSGDDGPVVTSANLFTCDITLQGGSFIDVENDEGILKCEGNSAVMKPTAFSLTPVAGNYARTCKNASITYNRTGATSFYVPGIMTAECGNGDDIFVKSSINVFGSCKPDGGFYKITNSYGQLECDD